MVALEQDNRIWGVEYRWIQGTGQILNITDFLNIIMKPPPNENYVK